MNGEAVQRQQEQQQQQLALAAGLLLVLLWGASFSIQKSAYSAMGPATFLFGRSLVMAVCAIALLRWRASPLWPALTRPEWSVLLGCTAIGQIVHILPAGCRLARQRRRPDDAAGNGRVLALHDLGHAAGAAPRWARGAVLGDAALGAGDAGAERTGRAGRAVRRLQRRGLDRVLLDRAGLGLLRLAALDLGQRVRGVAHTAPLLYGVPPVAGVVAWLTLGEGFGGVKLAGAVLALIGVAWTQRRIDPPSP